VAKLNLGLHMSWEGTASNEGAYSMVDATQRPAYQRMVLWTCREEVAIRRQEKSRRDEGQQKPTPGRDMSQ
jgi:hypothetical protein